MKLVRCIWRDACVIALWTAHEAPQTKETCETVGYLVREDADRITVAATISGDDFNAGQQIERSDIESLVEIKEAP